MPTALSKFDEACRKIDGIRGKHRKRTLDANNLWLTLKEAKLDGWSYRAGGTVANNYKYPANRMRMAVIRRSTGVYLVWCDWGLAKKGSSPLPCSLPRQYTKSNEKFGQELRSFSDTAKAMESALVILPRNTVSAVETRQISGQVMSRIRGR